MLAEPLWLGWIGKRNVLYSTADHTDESRGRESAIALLHKVLRLPDRIDLSQSEGHACAGWRGGGDQALSDRRNELSDPRSFSS